MELNDVFAVLCVVALLTTPLTAAEPLELTYLQSPVSGDSTDDETLRLGAFNIQVFGTTKASKPEVMGVLGKIVCTYDVVAIQEIRDKSQTALSALVDVVNANSSTPYDYVVSERLGRTSGKEQYAYIYNNRAVDATTKTTNCAYDRIIITNPALPDFTGNCGLCSGSTLSMT